MPWRTNVVAALCVAGLATSLVTPVTAHHSHANYDITTWTVMEGTVKQLVLMAPHSIVYLDVKNEKGDVVSWTVEMSNITNMQARGIFRSTFKAGDVVTVKLNPLKDGRPGGNYTSVVAADGKAYE